MSTAKKRLLQMINEVPDSELTEVLYYVEYINNTEKKNIFKSLYKSSESGLNSLNENNIVH